LFDFLFDFSSGLPADLNVFTFFELPSTAPPLEANDEFLVDLAASTDGTVPVGAIRNVMRKQVRELERKMNFLDFAVKMLESTANPAAAVFANEYDNLRNVVNVFYSQIMMEFRLYHNVWNRVPYN